MRSSLLAGLFAWFTFVLALKMEDRFLSALAATVDPEIFLVVWMRFPCISSGSDQIVHKYGQLNPWAY